MKKRKKKKQPNSCEEIPKFCNCVQCVDARGYVFVPNPKDNDDYPDWQSFEGGIK